MPNKKGWPLWPHVFPTEIFTVGVFPLQRNPACKIRTATDAKRCQFFCFFLNVRFSSLICSRGFELSTCLRKSSSVQGPIKLYIFLIISTYQPKLLDNIYWSNTRFLAGTGKSDEKVGLTRENKLAQFNNWFTWCHNCRHGGHAGHMLSWFRYLYDLLRSFASLCPV